MSRGGLLAFAGSFIAMLLAGAILGIAELGSRESIHLLWFSSARSVVAILGAVAAVLLARR